MGPHGFFLLSDCNLHFMLLTTRCHYCALLAASRNEFRPAGRESFGASENCLYSTAYFINKPSIMTVSHRLLLSMAICSCEPVAFVACSYIPSKKAVDLCTCSMS